MSFLKQKKLIWLFIILVPSVVTLGSAFTAHLFEHKVIVANKTSSVNKAFKDEMQGALNKTKIAIADKTITDSILNNDSAKASAELLVLAKKLNLSTMVAVNSRGIAIARTPSTKKNDLVFLTTPWGLVAAQGKEVVMVDEGRNFPLIINSAVPIIKKNKVYGALFGGYILNDAYATEFKNKYLGKDDQLALYSTKTGVYGTSFNDLETNRLFKLFFSEGSNAIQKNTGLIAGHFKIGNTVFHVSNIKLSDANGQNIGGIFILTPTQLKAPPIVGGVAGLLFTVFLYLHIRKSIRKQHKTKHLATIAFISATILVVGAIFLIIREFNRFFYTIQKPINTIYNSTISLSPGSDIFELADNQQVAIQITTGGEFINAAKATINYDPHSLQVEEIFMNDSFCDPESIIEKNINNNKGEVSISCIKPNGLTSDNAILAELLIQPLKIGQLNLQFGQETQVLANDGLGTSVLRTTNNGSYTIFDSRTAGRNSAPVLFSISNPNQSRWYNKKNIIINWTKAEDNESFAYAFNQTPDNIPDATQLAVNTSINLEAKKDGIYYFHIKPIYINGTGPAAHLKIMVDTTPPAPPIIKVSSKKVDANEIIRFKFANQGYDISGFQKNFYVSYDGGVWLPYPAELSTAFSEVGTHKISVRVFDNAGNYSDASTEINIQ